MLSDLGQQHVLKVLGVCEIEAFIDSNRKHRGMGHHFMPLHVAETLAVAHPTNDGDVRPAGPPKKQSR